MLQRLDDVLAEIFQPLDLQRFLFERLVQPRVFDGDRDITGDGRKQLEIVARKVVAVDGLAQADECDGTIVKRQAMK